MRRFLQKAIEKIDKMDRDKIRNLVCDIAAENELLEIVLNSMTDGVLVTDSAHRIIFFNKISEWMIPFHPGDLAEKIVWEAISDKEISEFIESKLKEQERVIDQEFTLEKVGNKVLAISILPMVREEGIWGNLIHIMDITEKRTREARLRRAESLAALTTLTAGVAHEIKNPLASIGIHLQLIKKAIDGRGTIETDKIGEFMSIIEEEVERLNRIVVDFLFAVRPMDTRLKLEDVNRIVREMLEFLKFELQGQDIQVELKLGESIPHIRADEKYMKQALLNIVKNAISAMPDGGTLRIETRQERDELQLKIGDTGIGIPEENITKIFEPYFTTKEFGSGLGLTMVYKIIKEHLGEISVSSKEGEGTTFILSFPIPQEEKRLIGYEGQMR